MQARTLDNVLREAGVSNPRLIKMNIEGGEIDALLGMRETLSVTNHVVVSCHDFVAENHARDPAMRTYDYVKRILQDAGYNLRERGDDPDEEVKFLVYGGRR